MNTVRRLSLIVIILMLFIVAIPAHAATTIITDCTQTGLETAITNATGGDTLTFNCGATTIYIGLALGDGIEINKNLTINGGGMITLDGNSIANPPMSTRIFRVTSGASLTVNNLTFQNTYASIGGIGGGAAYVEAGSLTVSNSTFTGNTGGSGGAIYVATGSSATISSSTFSDNQTSGRGGAIYVQAGATATINNSTFSDNEAPSEGSGISNEGITSVSGSSLFNNKTGGNGGAFYNTGKLTISNSTIFNNPIYPGFGDGTALYAEGASLTTITNSTVANNSGRAIVAKDTSSVIMESSTFYGSYSGTKGHLLYGEAFPGFYGRNNIFANTTAIGVDDGGLCFNFNFDVDASNLSNYGCHLSTVVPDLMLGAFDGTIIPLLAGSPAIDAVGKCVVSVDQIGTSRPQGTACDAGAYEAMQVTTSTGEVVIVSASATVLGCALNTADGVEVANAPDNTYCRVLMSNGSVVSYSGAIPADLIGLGVISAVDVYRLEGGMSVNTFPDYARICLSGTGRYFYMDGRNAPRFSIEMPTETVDGLTCAWIPAPGTVILTN